MLPVLHFRIDDGIALRLQHIVKPPVRLDENRTGSTDHLSGLERADIHHEPYVLFRRGLELRRQPLPRSAVASFVSAPERTALRYDVSENLRMKEGEVC